LLPETPIRSSTTDRADAFLKASQIDDDPEKMMELVERAWVGAQEFVAGCCPPSALIGQTGWIE
jgi:hypothetical protein